MRRNVLSNSLDEILERYRLAFTNTRLIRFVWFPVLLMNSSDPADRNVYSTRYAEMPALQRRAM